MSYTSVFGGNVIQPAPLAYVKLDLTADVSLSWPTEFQTANSAVAAIMDIDLDGNYTITLPDATLASVGTSFLMNNLTGTTQTITVNNYNGDLVTTIPYTVDAFTYTTVFFYLSDTSDAAGVYTVIPYGGGNPGLTSIGIDAGSASFSSNISITNTPLTANGAIDLDFVATGDLSGLVNFGASEGFPYRTYGGTPTWTMFSIEGTLNQIIATVDATSVTLSLDEDITGLSSIAVGDFSLNGSNLFDNCLSSTYAGDISIYPASPYGLTIQSTTSNAPDSPYLKIMNGGSLYLGSTNGTNKTGLSGGASTVDINYVFPTAAPVEVGQVLGVSSGSGSSWTLGWANSLVYTGVGSTANTLARYINTTGGLQYSNVLLSDTNELTNVYSLSLTQGATSGLILGSGDSNTIASASSSITLTPNGISELISSNTLMIRSGNSLQLRQADNTLYASLSCPDLSVGINHNVSYLLPSVAPTNNSLLFCSNYNTAIDPYQVTLDWSDILMTDTDISNVSNISGPAVGSLTITALDTSLILGSNAFPSYVHGTEFHLATTTNSTFVFGTSVDYTAGINMVLTAGGTINLISNELNLNTTNAIACNTGFYINTGNNIRFYNAGNTNYIEVNGANDTEDYTLSLPTTAPVGDVSLRCDATGQLYWGA